MDGLPGIGRLFTRHLAGLSDPRNGHAAAPARLEKALLYGLPVSVSVAVLSFDVDLGTAAESLAAGLALVAGVLVAVFTQFAAWRSRLDERARTRFRSEAPARRSLDAAAAHALVGVLASAISLVPVILLAADVPLGRLWNGLAALLATYVLGLLVVIVRYAFVAYETGVDDAVREADRALARGEVPPPPPRPRDDIA